MSEAVAPSSLIVSDIDIRVRALPYFGYGTSSVLPHVMMRPLQLMTGCSLPGPASGPSHCENTCFSSGEITNVTATFTLAALPSCPPSGKVTACSPTHLPANSWVCWVAHDFPIGGDYENADEQERREESVDHGCIEEGFHGTSFWHSGFFKIPNFLFLGGPTSLQRIHTIVT